ncbi:TPA: hypothetical protein HA351_00655 [Methanosarcinaceae archaeon]|nr:hypothetical protein [Methanosarcinaceae archaeon]
MKTSPGKTIQQILEEFLAEQQARLRPKTYLGYEEAIYFFRTYLNGYAHQFLDRKEDDSYDRLYDSENKQFWQIFGPEHLGNAEITDFLSDFMVKKIAGNKTLMETTGRVMLKLVNWLHEKGYTPDDEFKKASKSVKKLKPDLPLVGEVTDLIYDYVQKHPVEDHYTSDLDAYFSIEKIEPGKLWVEDYLGSGKIMGPVLVSEEISSKCKVGWAVSLRIVKTGDVWRILETGYVYPK